MLSLTVKSQSVGIYGEMNISTTTLPVISEEYANGFLDEVAKRATILEVSLSQRVSVPQCIIRLTKNRKQVNMYSFDKVNTDRWSDLADEYQSMIDELASVSSDEDILIPVPDFDVDEVL